MDPLSAYVPGILLAYTAVMLALMSPGPNILAVIGTSMGVGRRQGIALALGVACGTFLWCCSPSSFLQPSSRATLQ